MRFVKIVEVKEDSHDPEMLNIFRTIERAARVSGRTDIILILERLGDNRGPQSLNYVFSQIDICNKIAAE